MMKVLVATEKPFSSEAVQKIFGTLSEANLECILLEKYTSKAELLEAVHDVDALIVRSDKVDCEVLEAAKNLKVVVRAGSGYDNVDCDTAKAKSVVVMNTPGQNANAVAELAVGMLLCAIRNQFNGQAGFELKDKALGILGYGAIGRNISRIVKGFGMSVNISSRTMTEEKAAKENSVYCASPESLFSNSQIVSVNIPSNANTRSLVNYELMMKMPKNAVLLNTARKDIINEDDLARVLDERHDFMYISDVAPSNRDLFETKFSEQVLFTAKKMGAQTAEANVNAGNAAASQIVRFLYDNDTSFQVNK